MSGTYINDAVKMLEPVLFEDARVHVIWKQLFEYGILEDIDTSDLRNAYN